MFLNRLTQFCLVLVACSGTTAFAQDFSQRDMISTCDLSVSVHPLTKTGCTLGAAQTVHFDLQAIGYAPNNQYNVRMRITDSASGQVVYDAAELDDGGYAARSDNSGRLFGFDVNQFEFDLAPGDYEMDFEVQNKTIWPAATACRSKVSFGVKNIVTND